VHIPRVVRSIRPWASNRASALKASKVQPAGAAEADLVVPEEALPEDDSAPGEPTPERVVVIRPRSVLMVLLVLAAVAAVVSFFFFASWGLTLVAIALFLALALNPAVGFFQRRGLRRHWAVFSVCIIAVAVLALLVLVLIPPLVSQLTSLVNAVPDFVAKLRQGTGPAGVLERKYQVVERVQAAANDLDLTRWSGAAASGLSVVRSIASSLVGVILIAFLTLFMLLEGPDWHRRLTALLPESNGGAIERIGSGVYKAVGGFVTGNLLASLAGGIVATVLLLATGVPFALPLGVFVVVLELVPYLGPAVVTVVLTLVGLTQGVVPALVVCGVLVGYHALEAHTLRPLIYGRALKLSPLTVIISILLGTELAGVLGALAAMPVAGAIQVTIAELLRQRNYRRPAAARPLTSP
jgi:predicted PurR-regulated permease PerM